MNELEIVKTKLTGKAHFDDVHIQNWQVSRGIIANDIIWPNLGLFE